MIPNIYKFAEFTLNPSKRVLYKADAEIKVRDKDFDVLTFLIERAPKLCSFDEIIKGVWEDTNVENGSVEKAVANIRKVLADDTRSPRFIKTVRTKGYLFFGDVQQIRDGGIDVATRPGGTTPERVETIDRTSNTAPIQNPLLKKSLWALVFTLVIASALLFWKGHELWKNLRSEVVFSEGFSGGVINPNSWKYKGKSVKLVEQTIKISVDETDNPGVLRSEYFLVDPSKMINIESRMKVTFSQNMKDKVYFGGMFGLIPKTFDLEESNILEESNEVKSLFFGVRYMNYDSDKSFIGTSGETIQEIRTEGFFLVRRGGRPNAKSEYAEGKISERIDPSWARGFEQKIAYNPTDGQMMYFINGEKKGEFNVGKLQAKDNQIRLEIIPWGWWVNHSIEIDFIKVSQ